MPLPKLTDLTRDLVVTLGDDLHVTFQLRTIPGAEYQQILDDHRDDDGKATHEAVAVPVMTAGIAAVYSSVESTPAEFTEADAVEVWNDWPEWARWLVYQTCVAYTTRGPNADPFGKSTQKESGES